MLFRFFFFNDLEEKVNCMLMKFADNIKLEGVELRTFRKPPVNHLEPGLEKIERRLNLEKEG